VKEGGKFVCCVKGEEGNYKVVKGDYQKKIVKCLFNAAVELELCWKLKKVSSWCGGEEELTISWSEWKR
jgi:hypothetical protein